MTTIKRYLSGIFFCLIFLAVHGTAFASDDKIQDFYDETKISGDIRSYYFTRDYTNPTAIDQAAYSLGGNLGILTGSFLYGFKMGATLYTAQSLGLNSDNPKQVDQTLPGDDITPLGQLYLQYQHAHFLIRGGDQLINTPWLNAADSRMIPATYRGAYGEWTPNEHWTVSALRIYEMKSRVANHFSATNAYNPQNFGIPIKKLGGTTDDGATAVGAAYRSKTFTAQAWFYQFYDFANLYYGDFEFRYLSKTGIHPLIGMQALTETGSGDNILAQTSTGAAAATAFGAIIGAEIPFGRITVAYNNILINKNSFNNGNIVSPYTFTSDPLYTTSMIAGLVDKTAGQALKAALIVDAFEKRLHIITSFAQYYTQPYLPNTNETDFDVTYSFKKASCKGLRGLSIRNRLGIMNGDPAKGTFYYNRLMLQYDF